MTKFEPKEDLENPNVSQGSPLYDMTLLLAGSVAILVVLYFVISLSVDTLVPKISVAWERKLFDHIDYSSVMDLKPIVDGPVYEIFQPLTQNANWLSLGIQCTEEPNAFALPGGQIVVTSGLLEGLKTPAGLRFVLGHELGHFMGRHHLRGLGKGLALLSVMSVFSFGGLNLPVFESGVQLGQLAHQRDHEREADLYAVQLIDQLGFELSGSDEFFEFMLNSKDRWQEKIPTLMKTHPGTEERLIDLRRQINPQAALSVVGDAAKIVQNKTGGRPKVADAKIDSGQKTASPWGPQPCLN